MIEKLKPYFDEWIDDNGTSWENKKGYLQIEILGLCGCGNPDAVMEYMFEMFNKINNHHDFDYKDLPSMFFLYWANDKDFAEHGSTVRYSWLTEKGKEVLSDIKQCKTEDKDNE